MKINTECNNCGGVINTKIKQMGNHIVSVRCIFCGDVSDYQVDKENGIEKKIKNYQEIIARKHKKIEELQDELNMANGMIDYKNEKFVSEIGKLEKHYESQLKAQDNELSRRLTIIHYLESKLFKGVEND